MTTNKTMESEKTFADTTEIVPLHIQAFILFCDSTPLGSICKQLGVSLAQLGRWKETHDWVAKRDELDAVAMVNAKRAVGRLITEQFPQTIADELDITKLIRSAIKEHLNTAKESGKPISGRLLEQMSRSLSQASAIDARSYAMMGATDLSVTPVIPRGKVLPAPIDVAVIEPPLDDDTTEIVHEGVCPFV